MQRLRSKLTYANTTATLAVFLALGGSAFAVSRIDGHQIRSRSVPGSKLERHAVTAAELKTKGLVVPRAIAADEVAKLNITSAIKRRPKDLHGRDVATGQDAGSLIRMSVGDELTILQRPPFTLTSSCVDTGNQNFVVKIAATSSEDGWLASGATPHSAGESVVLAESTPPASQPLLFQTAGTQLLITASGAAVAVSTAFGVHVAGADCVVYATAIG